MLVRADSTMPLSDLPEDQLEHRAREKAKKTSYTTVVPDPFLEHYFKRIPPEVAASFTPEQRYAIKKMFGARDVASHSVELRRSFPFGRRRFYMIFLMGRERREYERLKSEGQLASYFAYVFAALVWLAPAFALAAIIQLLME